ncbi:MAG: sugar phosphate isomerase/epimerase [Candidatus Heimdallarchaeota archaeon]
MKVGFALEPIRGLPLDLIVDLLKKTFLEHFEFNWRIIPKIDDILKTLRKTTTTFHLPIFYRDGFDFSSKNDKYEIQIQEITSFVNQQKGNLNLSYVLVHCPEDPNYSLPTLFERLEQIEAPIVFENVVGQTDEHFKETYFQVKANVKNLAGFALDISHRYVNNWETWLNIPEELVKEIEYVHISDCTKTEDLHLPMGLGEMPFNDFFAYLKRIGYNGIIMQELKPDGNQALEIMSSTRYCMKPFSKTKYLRMKIRHALMRVILNIRKREFKDVIEKTAEEIGYDWA